MNTLTLASIHASQGYIKEAIEIYKEILKNDPSNKRAKEELDKLLGIRKRFEGVNSKMRDRFINIESDEELRDFERWLGREWI
jgi:tetratricopeptide (TPR) repeat protein